MKATAFAFIHDMIRAHVLEFGDFKLKSGIRSPYFFNLGNVSSGSALSRLGFFFAQKIYDLNLQPEVLYGPAYKGIPLATTTALSLSDMGQDVGVSFNRKESKQHGEGGNLVGSTLNGKRVLIVDDVVTDGASKVEAFERIRTHGGQPFSTLVALDRKEKDPSGKQTMLQALEIKLDTPVYSIATLGDIVTYLNHHEMHADLNRVNLHVEQHCIL